MKLRYVDTNHQRDAVAAIVDLFEGQESLPARAEFLQGSGAMPLTVQAAANQLALTDAALLRNLQSVQKRHNKTGYAQVICDDALAKISHEFDGEAKNGMVANREVSFCNFSLEMETGTGKTYLFLRAMHELAMRRGFRKFIVITPTVAVRENTLSALAATGGHFSGLYRETLQWQGYKSENLGAVGEFARAETPRALVMTIASFNKAANVMLNHNDRMGGELPLAFLQASRPVLILDEPQNMESDLSEESLARLNPLFALRFSATHKTPHNMIFRLSPADASNAGMVKSIQVGAVVRQDESMPLMELVKTEARGENLSVHIKMNVRMKSGEIRQKKVRCLPHDDLLKKSRLMQYEGYRIKQIDREPDKITFYNGKVLAGDDGGKEDIFRAQIKMTIDEHFSRQEKLLPQKVKALSLFFIDRVKNYRESGGLIRRIFEDEYEKARRELLGGKSAALRAVLDIPAAEVHDGYFAASAGGNTERDAASFNLIMRDKESLLSFPAKGDGEDALRKKRVAFIFSHSALREGWDNPNIFQICTLNATASRDRKRQELGRGLRICVDQNGARLPGEHNVLTVVANSSYEEYARDYQNEMAEDYRHLLQDYLRGRTIGELSKKERAELEEKYPGILTAPALRQKVRKARANAEHLQRKNGDAVFSAEFSALWERISHQTRYVVDVDEGEIVKAAVEAVKESGADVPDPNITYTLAGLEHGEKGKVKADAKTGGREVARGGAAEFLPDIPALMADMLKQHGTPLHISRGGLADIVTAVMADKTQKSKILANPVGWAGVAVAVLRDKIGDIKADGVRYEKTGKSHDWKQHFANDLAQKDRELFSAYIAETKAKGKPSANSIADFVGCDSNTEKTFAEALAKRDDIKLFVKLPRWFTVPTPVGEYCPDWAILLEHGKKEKLYLISETKGAQAAGPSGATSWENLRGAEGQKIKCAAKHFGSKKYNKTGALDGVDYVVATKADDIKAGG